MSTSVSRGPLVSIVLTTFNRADLLRGALASCLGQSCRDLEVIVVDDASADHTPEVVESVRRTDARVRYLRMPVNGGQSRALNAGFAACGGQLITWTSDDNRFKPAAIETMAAELARSPEVDLVFADFEDVTPEGAVLRRRSPTELTLPDGYAAAGVCFLYRRRVYEEVGDYDTRLRCCPDLDYWIRVQHRFKVHHLPVVLYENGVHPQMVSIAAVGRLYAETGRVLARHAPWRKRPALVAEWYDRAASAEMKRGHRSATLAYAWTSALLDPRRLGVAVRRTYALAPPAVRGVYRVIRRALVRSA